jgi:rod shape-determining protein MreC
MESVCFYLIVRNNNFQQASIFHSANKVATSINDVVNSVKEYINLKEENEALAYENASLRSMIDDAHYVDSVHKTEVADTLFQQQYTFLTARVINNSVNRRNNYLTLDKGSKHGIKPEMGVICASGIVGIVKDVSENFCTVISFLHKDSRISARIKKNNYIGSMVWDGFSSDEGSLKDIAKHVKLQKGDTIITSSFSAIFPEGIMIGTVRSVENDPSENFFKIKIKLSTSFGSLSHVYIVNNLMKEEQRTLEALEKDVN